MPAAKPLSAVIRRDPSVNLNSFREGRTASGTVLLDQSQDVISNEGDAPGSGTTIYRTDPNGTYVCAS